MLPFLPWLKWPHIEGEQGTGSVASGDPGRGLMRELIWQIAQRERQALEKEPQHHFSRGTLGHLRPCTRPSSFTPMPASERRQLEELCAHVPASHAATVLSRFCEILAHSDVLPWELGCVFEWVLKDFLRRQEEVGHRLPMPPHQPPLLPVSPPPAGRSTSKWPAYFAPSSPDLQEGHREEIPTISSCVDRHVRRACPASVQRDSLNAILRNARVTAIL
uniref:Uncharacterized protein n=1 Tax=Electrophorus electricus TaxID=8005 RepID=A0A4W4HGV2_ELEEL